MAAWTKEEAKNHLRAWLDAELAVSTGQSYKIGTRELTRSNLMQIRERINFWKTQVEKLETGRRGPRVIRVVPRDT